MLMSVYLRSEGFNDRFITDFHITMIGYGKKQFHIPKMNLTCLVYSVFILTVPLYVCVCSLSTAS